MTKQTTIRIAVIVLLLALAALVLITCNNNAAPAPAATTAPAAPPATTDGAATEEGAASETASDAEAGAGGAGSTGSTEGGAAAVPFVIDPAASEARFLINESLLGIPTEVKGVTNQITGTIEIDAADPAATGVGVITINARDLRTDRDLRNRAIRRFILESNKDEYQFITFTPTAVTGLPASAAPGDSFTFQVTGDLKIKDVSQPVTFDVQVTADSVEQISGIATATVKRSDFNLEIPSAPGVADVTDEVRVELAFTAKAQS